MLTTKRKRRFRSLVSEKCALCGRPIWDEPQARINGADYCSECIEEAIKYGKKGKIIAFPVPRKATCTPGGREAA